MATEQRTEFQEQDQQQSTQQNQSKLVPFVQIDGEWILSDTFMISVFDKIVEQDLLKTTFWEGTIVDASQFLGMAKSPNNHVVLFLIENYYLQWLRLNQGLYLKPLLLLVFQKQT